MAYRNDFYSMRNIIGYTGDIRYNPTVYFQRGDEYGHITQAHNLPFNVGREEVCLHRGYHIDNYFRGGKWRSIEWEGAEEVHTSRNPFIRRQFFNPGDILTLGIAIYRFQEIKPMYRRGVMRQAAAKRTMQNELKSLFHLARNPRYARNIDAEGPAMRLIESQAWA